MEKQKDKQQITNSSKKQIQNIKKFTTTTGGRQAPPLHTFYTERAGSFPTHFYMIRLGERTLIYLFIRVPSRNLAAPPYRRSANRLGGHTFCFFPFPCPL